MKHFLLLFLLIICMHLAHAQNNNWFKGTWYGAKSFASAHIGIKVPVRIEVDSVDDLHFSGRFIYMYPADTTARLIKTFSGNLRGASMSINKASETYLRDPRTRSFWSDCAACDETARFSLTDSTFVVTITTANCGDSCNGETVLSRGVNRYNTATAIKVKKLIVQSNTPSIPAIDPNKKTQKTTAVAAMNQPLNNKPSDSAATNTAMQSFNSDSLKHLAINNYSDTNHVSASSSTAINTNQQQQNKNAPPTKEHSIDSITSNQISGSVSNAIDTINHVAAKDNSTQPLNKIMPDTAVQERIRRKTDLVNTLQITASHIKVELFDNGEVDSDAVSVYYNGRIIINNEVLTTKAITFYIDASATNRHIELTLIAENEGSIPPNSALMRVTAGDKQFNLFISTSLTKNAKISLDYIGN